MHWSRNAIAYQIYPLSFKDSNGDGKGDLAGILEKIDYLNGAENSLGINAVWLCPFYKSPMHDMGYDISDYTDINTQFGDLETFEKLIHELHARNIKVIIDFVGNHTSFEHPWFVESRSSRENPKRNWYVWRDGDDYGNPPNNWLSIFGGSAWEYDKKTEQYYLHTFLKEQPDLNWHNPDVRKTMMEVIDFWAHKGVDGFRIDAFYNFIEDEFLRDDPINPMYVKDRDEPYKSLTHRHSLVTANKMGLLTEFVKEALKKHEDILIVAEAYISSKDMHTIHDLMDTDRFTIFNFSFIGSPFTATEYKRLVDEYLDQGYSNPKFLPNFTFGNHDVSRLVSRIGEAEARLAAFLQFTLPGLIFVYNGDELGMSDGKITPDSIRDKAAQIIFKQTKTRDPERTPMQWDDSVYAGFSSHKPWLPINDNYKTLNIAHSERDTGSILSLYKNLIRIRQSIDALRVGSYVPRNSHSSHVFSFEVHHGDERYLIAANFSNEIKRELIPTDSKNPAVIFSSSNKISTNSLPNAIELMPLEGYIVKL